MVPISQLTGYYVLFAAVEVTCTMQLSSRPATGDVLEPIVVVASMGELPFLLWLPVVGARQILSHDPAGE